MANKKKKRNKSVGKSYEKVPNKKDRKNTTNSLSSKKTASKRAYPSLKSHTPIKEKSTKKIPNKRLDYIIFTALAAVTLSLTCGTLIGFYMLNTPEPSSSIANNNQNVRKYIKQKRTNSENKTHLEGQQHIIKKADIAQANMTNNTVGPKPTMLAQSNEDEPTTNIPMLRKNPHPIEKKKATRHKKEVGLRRIKSHVHVENTAKLAIERVKLKKDNKGISIRFLLRNLDSKKIRGYIYAVAEIQRDAHETGFIASPKEISITQEGEVTNPEKGISFKMRTLVYKELSLKTKLKIKKIQLIAKASDGSQLLHEITP